MCGNCRHAGWGSQVSRGRLATEIPVLAQALKIHVNREYLSIEMVKTLENLFKIGEWSISCEKERTRVKLFEKGCSYWQPNCTVKAPLTSE